MLGVKIATNTFRLYNVADIIPEVLLSSNPIIRFHSNIILRKSLGSNVNETY